MYKKIFPLLFIFVGLSLNVMGQIVLPVGSTVTENFSVGTSATATLPSGWRVDKNNSARTLGTYSAAGTTTEFSSGNGTTSSLGIHNFGAGDAGTATDRAIGGLVGNTGAKSVNIYAQFVISGTTPVSSLRISYNVEKYRNGTNPSGFQIQLYYSTNGTSWTTAGTNFLTSFAADANNNGFNPAPGTSSSVTNKSLNVSLTEGSIIYLAWNYSVATGSTTNFAPALGIDDISINAYPPGGLIQRDLPTLEHFDYSAGRLSVVASSFNWGTVTGSTANTLVSSGNLIHADYPMPATGNLLLLNSSNIELHRLALSLPGSAGSKIYVSFLLNVLNSTGLGSGAYFVSFGTVLLSSNGKLYIRSGTTGYQLGIKSADETPVYYETDLSYNTTYLIVLCYETVASSNNNSTYLWINPDLTGDEPTPTVTTTGSDPFTKYDGLYIRQNTGTPNAQIDAIRVALSWADAPLPVELTSFTASVKGTTVTLNWETKTEIDNNGFEVERNTTGTWQKIGFVEGHGITNSPKYYHFTDNAGVGNKIQYRLKQIDNDGTFEYSPVVEVELNPTQFALYQNYPNPFNPVTVVRYSLPVAGMVTIDVFNSLGEKVSTLVNSEMQAGYHEVSFDAATLPSGLYFYEIKTGEFRAMKKMVLIK